MFPALLRRRLAAASFLPLLLPFLVAAGPGVSAGAAKLPVWVDSLMVLPPQVSFGNSSVRLDSNGDPHIAFYKDSAATRTLVYARRVGPGAWHRQYLLTVPDLAGPGGGHPGPWLGFDPLDVPSIVYTRQASPGGPWSIWRATRPVAAWVHQLLEVVPPPAVIDASIDLDLAAHVFTLQQGPAADTLRHSSFGTQTHHCSVLITPPSGVLDSRWMAGATTESTVPAAFVLNENDPVFGTGSVYAYSHEGNHLTLDAAFRNSFSLPGPYLTPPLSATQNPFGTAAVSGGPTAVLQGGAGNWEWIASNAHRVYQMGGTLGETQDLSYVDASPVVYSYQSFNAPGLALGTSGYKTVVTSADFLSVWAHSVEGPVSEFAGTPSLSADGRDGAYVTAVEDFGATRLIRFRAYDALVIGVGDRQPGSSALRLRAWPQPARSGGELWLGGLPVDGNDTVELFDCTGRRVSELRAEVRGGTMRTRVPRLEAGIYFVRTASRQRGRLVVVE